MDCCDLNCTYASFPDSSAVDGSRSCRTFAALYCATRKSLVHKNLPCTDKAADGAPGRGTKRRKAPR